MLNEALEALQRALNEGINECTDALKKWVRAFRSVGCIEQGSKDKERKGRDAQVE